MASPPEGRAVEVGLEERLVTMVVAATAGEPAGGGPDEGRQCLKRAPINGRTAVSVTQSAHQSAQRRQQRPSARRDGPADYSEASEACRPARREEPADSKLGDSNKQSTAE